MGLPVPLTSLLRVLVLLLRTPSVPPWYAAQVPSLAAPHLHPHLGTTGKRRAVDQAPAQRALPADHHLSHLGRGHGDDDVNEMADATNCTPPTHPHALFCSHAARTHSHTTHTHHNPPAGHQVYFVLQLPPAAAARHPQPAHTAARRRQRQRQRQCLSDLDLDLGLDLGLDLDLALIITLPPSATLACALAAL